MAGGSKRRPDWYCPKCYRRLDGDRCPKHSDGPVVDLSDPKAYREAELQAFDHVVALARCWESRIALAGLALVFGYWAFLFLSGAVRYLAPLCAFYNCPSAVDNYVKPIVLMILFIAPIFIVVLEGKKVLLFLSKQIAKEPVPFAMNPDRFPSLRKAISKIEPIIDGLAEDQLEIFADDETRYAQIDAVYAGLRQDPVFADCEVSPEMFDDGSKDIASIQKRMLDFSFNLYWIHPKNRDENAWKNYEALMSTPEIEKFLDGHDDKFFTLEWYLLWKEKEGRDVPPPWDRRFWPHPAPDDATTPSGEEMGEASAAT